MQTDEETLCIHLIHFLQKVYGRVVEQNPAWAAVIYKNWQYTLLLHFRHQLVDE
jgi:hypothetical protein